MDRISIALCTCNGMPWLENQLDSILNQTLLPTEMIVCDDRSTDNTLSILRVFKERAPFKVIIKINSERVGFCRNFEGAIKECNEEIIFLCDQDDVWKPNKIERYIREFDRDDDLMLVASNSELLVDGNARSKQDLWKRYHLSRRRRIAFNKSEIPIVESVKFSAILGHTIAIRKKVVSLLSPIPLAGHDYWIFLLASCLGRVYLIDTCLTEYRLHSGQQCAGIIGENLLKSVSTRSPPDHFSKKSDAYSILIERLVNVSAPSENDRKRFLIAVDVLRGKISYMHSRAAMRSKGGSFRRGFLSLQMLVDGSYTKYGRGYLSFLKDVLG